MAKLRAGVIGVGHLGRHHARLYASLPDSMLVGVVDDDGERASLIGRQYGARTFGDLPNLLEQVDVVSVAVPTSDTFRCQSLSRSRETCVSGEADRRVADRGSVVGGVGQGE